MRGYTHLAAGLAAGYLLFGAPQYVLASAAGSLLPDIDNPRSVLGRRIPLLSLIGGSHRSWMHSLAGAAIFALPAYLHNHVAGYAVAVGCITHLLLDFLNPKGIKFFWPFGRHRHIIGIPGDSIPGNITVTGIIILLIIFFKR